LILNRFKMERRKVVRLNSNGKCPVEYASVIEAFLSNGYKCASTVSNVLLNGNITKKGYYFVYYDEYYSKDVPWTFNGRKRIKIRTLDRVRILNDKTY